MVSELRLWLDHASIAVPSLAPAIAELDLRLGLTATPTPAAPDRHSRVYLDRSYLEVAAGAGGDTWIVQNFFLRFADPAALKGHLDAVGLRHRFDSYTGLDGGWDDVEIDAGDMPVPILVRRTSPPQIARAWPPPLRHPHRCGARTLDAVHVTVRDLGAAIDIYSRLTGVKPMLTTVANGASSAEFRLASGRIALSRGLASGIGAIVLGTGSLSECVRIVGKLNGAPVAWLADGVTHGLRTGFVQVG